MLIAHIIHRLFLFGFLKFKCEMGKISSIASNDLFFREEIHIATSLFRYWRIQLNVS